MAHIEFVIPLNRKDLLDISTPGQYMVQDVLIPQAIPRQLNDCKAALAQSGCTFVLEHFDTLFSVLIHAKDINSNALQTAFNIVIKALHAMCNSLPPYLEDEMNADFRQQQLNTAKMLLYLLTELHKSFDEVVSDHNKKSMAVDAKSRKRAAETLDVDWDDIREKNLQTLFRFIEMPLSKLWEPPVPDEDFVNLAANCCYRTLEDPNMAHVRFKPMRELIGHILGTLNRRYGHGMSCTVKMVQLLKLYEHLAAPLAEAAVLFTSEYGCRNFIREVVRELDSEFYTGNPPKGCAQFLVELAHLSPNLVLPIMDSIVPHLDNDVYGVRSSVLSVMGEVLSQTLSAELLNDEAKEIRDSFLEHLEEHLWDVNALVRAKVLRIWQQLCQEKAIPLSKLSNLLVNVIERLQDTSFPVTSRAIQLMTSLLQSNPFGAKINLPELRKNLEIETKRLEELEVELRGVLGKTPEEEWNEIFPELIPVIEATLTKKNAPCEISEEKLDDLSQKTLEQLLEIITDHLRKKMFVDALQVLKYAEQQFHGDKMLKCDRQVWDADVFLDLCQKIFQYNITLLNSNKSNRDDTTAFAEPVLTAEQTQQRETLLKQRALVEFLKDNINFAEKINEATTVISGLLLCGQTQTIQHAIEYLTAGTQFGLPVALEGFRTMLMLVWSNESSIKEAVAEAYKTLYLSRVGEGQANRAQAAEIMRRLLALLSELNDDEQAALERLVREWVRNNDLPNACVQILWEKFTLALPDTPENESRTALLLLSMIAGAEVLTVKTNITVLVTVGLGERGFADYRIVKDTCKMLLKLVPESESVSSNDEPYRLEEDHVIFQKLTEVLQKGFWNLKDKNYLPMAQEALDVIYQLSDHPDKTCANILRNIASQIKNGKPSAEEDPETLPTVSDCSEKKVPLPILERFVFFLGHIAYRQWAFLDRSVFRELKRRNRVREGEAEKKKGIKEQKEIKRKAVKVVNTSVTSNPNQLLSRASETPRPRKEKDKDDSAIEAEFPDITADDAEAEYINNVCEAEVVSKTSLLGKLSPILIDICRDPKKYPNAKLRSTACLALTKMMLVSSVFCDENLQLVFTLMEKATEPDIRSNMVLAIGDLANRFPNLIEPWTKHIYSRLRDESTEVRLKTMIVLKHLVMNEMVKVRGQISDLALCIVDDDERIYCMSRVLFNELSEKGNTLYNVLPDIISCLSNPASNVSEEKFRSIIEFLMPLISKNRLMESLVDKLCQRLRGSTCERQWSDIAFCLTLIQYTDRSIRKLTENFICFSDKLQLDSVYDAFQKILAQAAKTLKGGKEALVDELRTKIEDCMRRGTGENEEGGEDNDAEMSEATPKTPAPKSSRSTKRGGRQRGGRKNRRRKESSSEEESDDDSS